MKIFDLMLVASTLLTAASIVTSQVPMAFATASPTYGFTLFDDSGEITDGTVGLNQEVRAVVSTSDTSVEQITFRWFRPGPEIAREVTVPIDTPEDNFAPDEPGDWIVEADLGNGQVSQVTLTIFFFVLPESPVGTIAMIAVSMGALGSFLYFRKGKSGMG